MSCRSKIAKKASMSKQYELYRDLVLRFLDSWKPEPEDKWLITYLRNRIDVKNCLSEGTFNILTRKINRSILKDYYNMNCDEVMEMNPNELFRLMYHEQKRLKWDHKQTQEWISCVHVMFYYGLTLLAIHKDVPLSAEEVLNDLAKKDRKLDFVL